MFKKHLHMLVLCLIGHCCLASDESANFALTTRWLSYAGSSFDNSAVYATTFDSNTNSLFGGVLGTGWLENVHGVEPDEPLGGAGLGSGFVAMADKNGNLQWASALSFNGGEGAIYGFSVTNALVYAAGEIANKDSSLTYTWKDALLVSLDVSDGAMNWARVLSDGTENNLNTQSAYKSVAVDASGAIYAVGYTTITNLSSFSSHAGFKDVIVVKYDTDGTRVWARYLGGAMDDEANAISIGTNGLYVSGTTQSSGSWITQGNSLLPKLSNRCGFLSKLDFNGNVIYTTVLGGNENDEILSMMSVSNMIYLAGKTESTNFCTAVNPLNQYNGGGDGFVLKLTDDGTSCHTNWFRYVGTTNTLDATYSLALMESNRVVVCGSTATGGWLPGTDEFSRLYAGETDGFVLQLDRADGSSIWSTYAGGASNDVAYALAVCGTSVVLGGTTGSPEWGMFGGFKDDWISDVSITGFIGRWSQEPGVPPIITNDILDVTVHEGESVSFTVRAQSMPAAKYYWLTNGVPVGGTPTNRFVIASAIPSDNNTTYQCIASNVFGSATSSVARLTVIANGFLDVSLSPPSAIVAGAAWQLTGGVWRASSSIALSPGTYTIAFSNLAHAGWTTPATRQVEIVSGQTTTVSAAYTAPVATAIRTVTSWTNVSLAVTCPPSVTNWTLVENLPTNATPTAYGSGTWNGSARTLIYTGTGSATLSYTVLLGAVGDYLVSGSITSMPINVTMPVTGDNRVSRGNFLRKISGTNVWIYMAQPTTMRQWSVDEDLTQTTLQAFSISHNGDFQDGWIFWGDTSIGVVLAYSVTGTPGSTNILSGSASLYRPTVLYTVYGDNTIIIPALPQVVPPPTILSFSFNGTNASLTFTSVLSQAYMVVTNANIAVTNGWQNWLPATGQGATTTVEGPVVDPKLFFRVKVE